MRFRNAVLYLAFAVAALAQPTVSHVVVSDISHSSATVSWSNSTVSVDCRVKYGAVATYDDALSGIQKLGDNGTSGLFGVNGQVNGCQHNLYNLKANQTYHICPQSTADGSTWSACVDTTFSTSATPATHPAIATLPVQFDTTYPNTAGYTIQTVASDCSDLQAKINAAVANLMTGGTILNRPENSTCSGSYTYPIHPAVVSVPASGLDVTTGIWTKTAFGLPDGQPVVAASIDAATCSGGALQPANCGMPGRWAIDPGITYYIVRIDADHFKLSATLGGPSVAYALGVVTADTTADTLTVDYDDHGVQSTDRLQFSSTGTLPDPLAAGTTYYALSPSGNLRTFQVAATSGGAAIDLTTTGTGVITAYYPGTGNIGVLPYPPSPYEVIIRSAASDANLPPPGTRLTSAYYSHLASFVNTHADGSFVPAISTQTLSYGLRVGPGIWFTYSDLSTLATQTTNPGMFNYSVASTPESSRIILDRVRIEPPNKSSERVKQFAVMNGRDMALIDSTMDHLNNWFGGSRNGMGASHGSNTVTWTAGAIASGPTTWTFAGPVTATFSPGSVTGVGCVWFAFDGTLTFELPTGVTLSSVTGYSPTASSSVASPRCRDGAAGSWPVAGVGEAGGFSVQPFEEIQFTAGPITTLACFYNGCGPLVINDPNPAGFGADSNTGIIAGLGPGPFKLHNNYLRDTGITIHFDDQTGYINYQHGAQLFVGPKGFGPANITATRNVFTTDAYTMWGIGGVLNRYFHRNAFEVKNGNTGLFEGNIVERQFADVAKLGTGLVIQAVRGSRASNWTIRYNTFRNSGTGMLVMGAIASRSPVGDVSRNMNIYDNLVYGLDGAAWCLPFQCASDPVATSTMNALYGGEDFLMEHNTVPDTGSTGNSVVHFKEAGWEMFKVKDNFFDLAGTTFNEEGTGCPGINKTLADCLLTAGTGIPNWSWIGNITQGATTDMTGNATTTDPKFTNAGAADYSLQVSSPLKGTASDGLDVGIRNWMAFLQAQGGTVSGGYGPKTPVRKTARGKR